MRRFLLSFLLWGVIGAASAQVTVFTDNFNLSTGGSYTATAGPIGSSTTWSLSLSGIDWGARIDNNILDLTNDATLAVNPNADGWSFGYTPTVSFAAPYTTTLDLNVGVVTWTFNMQQERADPSGFSAVNTYGVAFILGGTSSTPATAGNGYAVVLGGPTTVDPIRLVRYTGGLQGTITDIITSTTPGLTDFGAEYLSIKVTYAPVTDTWELFLRNDLGPPFADPAVGVLTSQGTNVDATYTNVSLDYLGGYWQGGTTGSQTAFFDNTTVTVTYPNTITTGPVTPGVFPLVDCLTPGAGTVDFTSTDVFFVGNTFTAQLSDDIGSFASPVNIGSISGPPAEGNSPNGTIVITIPAGTVSGTGYLIRVVSDMPAVIGSSSAPIQVIQTGYCASSHTDYYRSITNGDWEDPTTWESSPDGIGWITPATLAPTFNANSILVRNTDTVTIASGATADSLVIQSGGQLIQSNGAPLTLNNGVGTDMTIQSGGSYVLNGTQPDGAGTVDVQSGSLVRVDDNSAPSDADDFAMGNSNVTFNTGCIYEWNTTFTPSWTGRTYFTNGQNSTFRFSQSPAFTLGGGSPTTIYGTLEANADIIIVGGAVGVPSDKTITHGILGTGNIDASAVIGDIVINAAASVLGGSGTLTTPSTSGYYLRLFNSTATMTSSKVVIGNVRFSGGKIILGNSDLTVSGSIDGYDIANYVQTDGTGFLKMNAVTSLRVFPVGYSNLNAIYINNGAGSDYSVSVENGVNPVIANPTYAVDRTWHIFANNLTAGVQVYFWYYTADAGTNLNPGVDSMEVLRHSGVAWSITPGNVTISPAGGNPWTVATKPAGALTINVTPDPFIVGKDGGWVLPIDCIISTRAQKRNNTGIISWTVNSCSEVNNFEVQRSVNNNGFQTIGTVSPVANQVDFSFTDPSLAAGTNLYRIKVNGFTGSSKYSNTVALIHNSNDILISSLAPNPVHNKALLTVSSGRNAAVDFKVFNMSGSLVKQWQSSVTEGNNTIEVNLAALSAGIYSVFAAANGSTTISRFVKQ